MPTRTLESTRFGTLEIDADSVLEFPAGLIGLGGGHYALLAPDHDAAFVWLHSVEDPDVALPVTNPWLFYGDYVVDISDEEARRIGVQPTGAAVWVTVRAGDQLGDFTANLRAPILIADGRGHQVINEASEAPVRAPLFPPPAVAA